MKRSAINSIIEEADLFIRSFGFVLPPFADYSPDEMVNRRASLDGIVKAGLGWDITDYGKGRFDELGLTLFTARNGNLADLDSGRGMLYAEKIMISRRDQLSPMHRHVVKAEDIINRGGAALVLQLYASAPDGRIDRHAAVEVPCDGMPRVVDAGGHIRLQPGESVTLLPGIWHAFWAETGDVLIGEVSTVNDDLHDNIFEEELDRFTSVEEDVAPSRLLVSDYSKWLA